MKKEMSFSGSRDQSVEDYELESRTVARKAAAEGMVLLKNENQLLPLKKESKIALYGAGAIMTIKGGMGSGDVNAREVVTIYDGLKKSGYQLTSEEWITEYRKIYEEARLEWRQEIWEKEDSYPAENSLRFFDAYTSTPFIIPAGNIPTKTDADFAIYVLSRNAGEGKDRRNVEGDYLLTVEEEKILKEICRLYNHVILILNVGGIVDLGFLDHYPQIETVLYAQQPGMEAGNAVADIISGKVTPSGKLTDTWAFHYEDYPSSESFSHNNGDLEHEKYEEGIYVGYRYFDTYDIPVRYGFGYGLSYTDFHIECENITLSDIGTKQVSFTVTATVTNVGIRYSGREGAFYETIFFISMAHYR